MQPAVPVRIVRSAARVCLLAALLAGAMAFAAWHLLPYPALEAETAAERFMAWEGTVWALGLGWTLFGIAALFNATDLSGPRPLEQVLQQAGDARAGRTLYSDLPAFPWMMVACGLALIVLAVAARQLAYG